MAIRTCSYYKCENYILDGVASGDFTMFGFPKDEERRKEWIIFGNVLNYDSKSKCFMCSDHFERKYICSNTRRRMLLGHAKPIHYESMPLTRSGGAEIVPKDQIVKNEEVDKTLELFKTIFDDQKVESTTKQSDDDGNTTKISFNGKHSTSNMTCGNTKKPKMALMSEEFDISPKITTFIFKGEEYVQMPKSLYMEEKMKLVEEIKRYKMFASQIESNLADLLNDL